MSEITNFAYSDRNIRFENRNGRVWVSLTDMATASGKLVGHWNSLKATQEFLIELETVIGIPITETIQGGQPSLQGTWAIEEVAIEFAGWCSVSFKVWMIQQIKTLLTQGYVALPQQIQPKLPSNQVAVQISRDIREITDNLCDNPRLAQFLIDHAISDIMPSQALLVGDRLKGVVEIAEELGFKVTFENRSRLGRFVSKICGDLAQQEERLVNGTMRKVKCYPCDSIEVKQAISNYFSK